MRAQDGVYERALAELRRGQKTGHWMWFIFPQLRGLGRSEISLRYGIASLGEASAYAVHPVLGRRLGECVTVLLGVEGRSAHQIFGSPDDLKLRSCLTLFELAARDDPLFARALQRYFKDERDPLTLAALGT